MKKSLISALLLVLSLGAFASDEPLKTLEEHHLYDMEKVVHYELLEADNVKDMKYLLENFQQSDDWINIIEIKQILDLQNKKIVLLVEYVFEEPLPNESGEL